MNLIELCDISKEYCLGDNTISVLNQIRLCVEPGEFVSIMGPSGSGKSTLMNLLGCLDRPTAGQYLLHGQRVDVLSDKELSRVRNHEIGFVFQNFNLLNDNNIMQNIALPLLYRGIPIQARKTQAMEISQTMGIGGRWKHKPHEVSGGQAQRAAIARALIGRPRLILADEPTGNLDSKTGQEIIAIFLKLHQEGHTIIMVTHDEKVAHIAQRIIRLADGKIVCEEKVEHPVSESMPGAGKCPAVADQPGQAQASEKQTDRGMRWRDLFSMSVREGLFAHPMRTLLTTLGVLFGVAAVIAMMAINEGARQQAMAQIQEMGLHNIRIRCPKMTREEVRSARSNLSMGLNLDDLAAIRTIPSVRLVVPIKEIQAEIAYGKLKPKGRIVATQPDYQDVSNFYAAHGRFLDAEDMKYYRRVCVLGKIFSKEVFAHEDPLGKKLYLGSEVFWVIGVMEGKNVPEGVVKAVSTHDLNHDIYIPISTAQKRFKQDVLANEVDEISIMVANATEIQPTSQLLEVMLARLHHNVRDFELVVPEELLRQSRKTQDIFDLVMVCLASISLVVGGIGIMNIMLATVTERVREIGIRRAIGASQDEVLRQFLVEAVAISFMGGGLGILCGWTFSLVISFYTGWQTLVAPVSIMLGFGVSTVVGVVFGIYPAWKASCLDPIKALNTT